MKKNYFSIERERDELNFWTFPATRQLLFNFAARARARRRIVFATSSDTFVCTRFDICAYKKRKKRQLSFFYVCDAYIKKVNPLETPRMEKCHLPSDISLHLSKFLVEQSILIFDKLSRSAPLFLDMRRRFSRGERACRGGGEKGYIFLFRASRHGHKSA